MFYRKAMEPGEVGGEGDQLQEKPSGKCAASADDESHRYQDKYTVIC